jgi:hypothetical protein
MKKKILSIVICMLMCATVVSVAGTININSNDKAVKAVSETSLSNSNIAWLRPNEAVKETSSFNTDWIHYDDGTCENGLGLTAGGTLHEAIKLTPTELAGYGPAITSIKVMHGCPLYPGTPSTNYIAWIYTGATSPSNPETGATIVGTGTCPAIDDYYYINLTTPYAFAETDTLWVGVGWIHTAGSFPCGFDEDTVVAGKGGWLWYSGGGWMELSAIGFPGSWNLWAGVGAGGNQPPVTPNAPAGPTSGSVGVSYSFTASTTDPEGDTISYLFDWGNGHDSGWLPEIASGATATASYAWPAAGTFDITVKAKDANGAESGVSAVHTIVISAAPSIEIGAITGGLFKVKAVINNNGAVAATNVSWSINLAGGIILLGKATTGIIPTIAADGTATITSKMIVGFGKTVITVTADTASKTQNATVLLVFIKTP